MLFLILIIVSYKVPSFLILLHIFSIILRILKHIPPHRIVRAAVFFIVSYGKTEVGKWFYVSRLIPCQVRLFLLLDGGQHVRHAAELQARATEFRAAFAFQVVQ